MPSAEGGAMQTAGMSSAEGGVEGVKQTAGMRFADVGSGPPTITAGDSSGGVLAGGGAQSAEGGGGGQTAGGSTILRKRDKLSLTRQKQARAAQLAMQNVQPAALVSYFKK